MLKPQPSQSRIRKNSANAEFVGLDNVSSVFMYALNYDPAHPESAQWQSDTTALLPIGIATVVACKDEAGNIAVQNVIPPYSLIPTNFDDRFDVFDNTSIETTGYILRPAAGGYLKRLPRATVTPDCCLISILWELRLMIEVVLIC
ncbi:hypothetical protein IJ596_08960 [bacterium]|nr:hypothetical protein [bacterium]